MIARPLGLLAGLLLGSVLAWFLVTQPLLTVSAGPGVPHADPNRLEAHVRVATYIQQQFEVAHGVVRDQRYQMDGKTYRNVISSFGPGTREIIVVGAHYDAFGAFPGADDNASGVAGLLDLNAVMITDTALYRNRNYHTGGDTPDTLDYERMAHAVDGVLVAVKAIASER